MKRVILVWAILLSATAVCGQEKGFTGYWGTMSGVSFNRGSEKLVPIEMSLSPGYNFNRSLFARLDCQFNYGLFQYPGARTFVPAGALGLSAGYMFLHRAESYLETYLGGGLSYGFENWKYNYAEWGIRINAGECSTRASFGLGIKYYGSRNSAFGNHWCVFGSFGFKFN